MTDVMAIFRRFPVQRLARLGLLAALLTGAALHAAAPPMGDWWGTVTFVVDGDTVRVRPVDIGGRPVAVRLYGIDAPEICQSGGPEARDTLKRQLTGQRVLVHGQAHDRYRRLLARIEWRGEDPAASLVASGWAWAYQFRAGQGPYAAQQQQAETRRLGLFAAGRPEAPAAFRKRHGACPHPARSAARHVRHTAR